MISKYNGKHKLIIAGPGAGKTHNMIEKVIKAVETLEPYRYIVVITYTNAATNEIKERLSKLINITENIYIGTIHSFMIRFIIDPYLNLVDGTIPLKKMYAEYNFDSINRIKNQYARSSARKNFKDKLKQNGLISFDEIISLSSEMLTHKDIREKVSKRIKYLFIDEFQDASGKQADVIESIRKGKYTKIECVGDPEQYIMGFSYKGSGIRKPNFDKIPFMKFKSSNLYDISKIEENYRSSKNIVDFINNFNCNVKQKLPKDNNIPIYFIKSSQLTEIIEQFKKLYNNNYNYLLDKSIFYIAKENKIVNMITEFTKVKESSIFSTEGAINKTLKLLEVLSGQTIKEYMEEHNLSLIQLRIQVIKLFVSITENNNIKEIEKYIESELKIGILKGLNLNATIKEYKNKFIRCINNRNESNCMNVHNSKGLEAGSVLVVAKDNKELLKWLECDVTKRYKDLEDTCRLGFVAFSRAKELLAMACLEDVDESTIDKLKKLRVHSV